MGFLFFFTGLIALMSVIGGVEANPDLNAFQILQMISVTLVGFASMILGVSYLQD
jgi:hypothetical protein